MIESTYKLQLTTNSVLVKKKHRKNFKSVAASSDLQKLFRFKFVIKLPPVA